jgi:hypothetical protein
MVARLLAHWQDATADELAAGRAWYRRARGTVRRIACLSGLPVGAVAGVIAALSPRCHWSVNVAWAGRLCCARAAGAPCPAISIGNFRRKAWAIAGGADPLDVLRGPKVVRFWRALIGESQTVAVDVWAGRAAMGRSYPGRGLSGKRYLEVESAYQLAAGIVGVSPRELQAAIWVHVRGDSE